MQLTFNSPKTHYYPFGMLMPGRSYSSPDYIYGFNGKEKTDEINGSGVTYDYGFRIYDSRLGRFLSVDPLTSSYPWYTPYQFAGNKPIMSMDIDGREEDCVNNDCGATEPNTQTESGPSSQTGSLNSNLNQTSPTDNSSTASPSANATSTNWGESDVTRLVNNGVSGLTDANRNCGLCCLNAFTSNLKSLYGDKGATSYPTNGNMSSAVGPLKVKGLSSAKSTIQPTFNSKTVSSQTPATMTEEELQTIEPNVSSYLSSKTPTGGISIFAVGPGSEYHSTLIVVAKTGTFNETTATDTNPVFIFVEDGGGARNYDSSGMDSELRDFIIGARKYYRGDKPEVGTPANTKNDIGLGTNIYQLLKPN